MSEVREGVEVKERALLALAVICAGGFMDAYSYLQHGKVFANGQTGNLVLLTIHFANGDWFGVLSYAIPILAFLVGIIASRLVQEHAHKGDRFRTQHWVITVEAVVFAVLAFVADHLSDLVVNSTIAFCAALLFQNFKTFGTKSTYGSVFVTGNIRALGNSLFEGYFCGNTHERHRAQRYAGLLVCFALGVFLGNFACAWMGNMACLAVSPILLAASAFISVEPPEELLFLPVRAVRHVKHGYEAHYKQHGNRKDA